MYRASLQQNTTYIQSALNYIFYLKLLKNKEPSAYLHPKPHKTEASSNTSVIY